MDEVTARRNTPIKQEKTHSLSRPSTRTRVKSMRDILLKLMLADFEPA